MLRKFQRFDSPLREDNPGGDGGGGDPPAPKHTTEEDVGRIVNAAMTSQLKRLNIDAKIAEALNPFSSKIEEIAKRLAESPAPPTDPPKDQNRPDPKLIALEEQHRALVAKLEASEKERAAIEEKSRRATALSELEKALSPHLKSAAATTIATRLLSDELSFDESGRPQLRTMQALSPGMPDEEMFLALGDGVAKWLKSDVAKELLPAPAPAPGQRGGAPSRQVPRDQFGMPRYDSPATSEDEKIRRASEKEAALAARFNITG